MILEGFVVSRKRQKTKVVQFLLFYERRCLTNNSIFDLLALELSSKLSHLFIKRYQTTVLEALPNNSRGSITKAHVERKERTAKKRKRRKMDNPQKLKNRKLQMSERLKRLTASHFSTTCKMKKSTKRGKSGVNILYSRFSGTTATRYGLENERNAIEDFEFKIGEKEVRCVLFVDLEYPWHAEFPDGLVGDDSILVVK
ncbi:hypothetical protein PR048_026613 [Dryococelus australis]|uniref:Uncharacterized protein n=1 Tax=Dryococelus australis TaxID=614101 RepID=A0ABQ9GLV5_9NEOP|nr:hypothetical protein PR048_026613 [Dryococelus australis]